MKSPLPILEFTPELAAALDLIRAEYERFVSPETGWLHAFGGKFDKFQLTRAGGCYGTFLQLRLMGLDPPLIAPVPWPVDRCYWQPHPKRLVGMAVKAGALYMAEQERLEKHEDLKVAETAWISEMAVRCMIKLIVKLKEGQ